MHLLWVALLMTGFLLVGVSTDESRGVANQQVRGSSLAEDGTGFPEPYPPPTKPKK